MVKYLFIIISILLSSSCAHEKKLDANNYMLWVEDGNNKLLNEKQIGVTKYSLQYKPLDYIAIRELGIENITKNKIDSVKSEIFGLQYMNLRISDTKGRDIERLGVSSNTEYSQRSNYLSFGFQNDIKLVSGNDTLPCTLFHQARNYGIAPFIDFVLGFPNSDKQLQDLEIIINDNAFGNGSVKFTITSGTLNSIPELII